MLDNVGLRYPHRASGAKAPRTLRPLPLLRFAVSATGGAHLCSIQYYLRFWLGICRTSLAVSALRIMRYCLKILLHFSLLQHTATAAGGAPCFKWGTACCFDGIETFDLRQNKTPGAIWHPVFQLNNRRNQTGIRGGENSKISLRGTGPAAGRGSAISAWRLPGSCRPQQRRGGRR